MDRENMYKKKIRQWAFRKRTAVLPSKDGRRNNTGNHFIVLGQTAMKNSITKSSISRINRRLNALGAGIPGASGSTSNCDTELLFSTLARSSVQSAPSLPDSYFGQQEYLQVLFRIQARALDNMVLPIAAFSGGQDQNAPEYKVVLSRRQTIDLHPTNVFYNSIVSGLALAQESQTKAAGAALERGFSEVAAVLKQVSPTMVGNIYILLRQLLEDSVYGTPIARQLANYLHLQARAIYGPEDPVTQFCKGLAENWNSQSAIRQGVQALSDFTAYITGKYDNLSLMLQAGATEMQVSSGLSFAEMSTRYEELLQNTAAGFPPRPRREIIVRRKYAAELMRHGHHKKAEEILWAGLSQSGTWEDPLDVRMGLFAAEDMSFTIMGQGATAHNYNRTHLILKDAAEKADSIYGPDAPESVQTRLCLGKFYSKWGNPEEANAQYIQVTASLEQFALDDHEQSVEAVEENG